MRIGYELRASIWAVALMCAASTVAAKSAHEQEAKAPAERPQQYLRVTEDKGNSISLEIASHDYVRADGTGPKVGLIGVAHIADETFYKAIAQLLEEYEVVLYESVKPEGTGGAGGETHDERVASTRAALAFAGSVIESYRAKFNTYPKDVSTIEKFAAERDARMVKLLQVAMIDAWSRPVSYEPITNRSGNTIGYRLRSFGADGKDGGEGENADLDLGEQAMPEPLALSADDGLQSQLADALGLEFQLTSLPYDKQNWRCSDMAMDEVNRRLAAKGIDFSLMGGTLAGTSFPATLIKVLLGMIKIADTFTEGAVTDTFKVVMIEVLSDPSILDQGLAQLGAGFGEVIINDRNQVVIDDLKVLIEKEPQVKSVAILYGAGHMPDLVSRMHEQLGYGIQPTQERWFSAMGVNLAESKVTPESLQMIRRMIKQSMRQQLRRSR